MTEPEADPIAELQRRVTRLEEAVGELKKKRKDAWDKAAILSPFMTAVVVAFLGYALNTTVTRALQEQQLQASNVKEMRELLLQLGAEDVTTEKAETTALALSAFGRYAIAPLVTILDEGGEVRGPAAEKGLRAIGVTDGRHACERLAAVAADRRALYVWTTHRVAVRLVGDLGCRDALPALDGFEAAIAGDAGLREAVRDGQRLDAAKLAEVRSALREQIERSRRLAGAPP
jgi:hypothetical protein